MPNWCDNVVVITHKNKEAIERVIKAFKKGELFHEFIPIPEELQNTVSPNPELDDKEKKRLLDKYGATNWYDFCINEWGTKWDIGDEGHIDNEWKVNTGYTVQLTFNTAWAPPLAFYHKLLNQDYNVVAYYYEDGMGFCGKYDNGHDECYHVYDDGQGNIPKDIDDAFNITERLKMDKEA